MNNLLYLQNNHRSQRLLTGGRVRPVWVCNTAIELPWDERYKQYVTMSGLGGLNKIGQVNVDIALISALVERWNQETHTFHMPVGELTITLEDVAVLLGLPIDGKALCVRTDRDWPAIVTDLLGHVDATTFNAIGAPNRINMKWLFKTSSHCPENADDNTVQQYARAYLLMLVGTVLFPSQPADSIPVIYLPLFEDFQKAGRYSWGSGVLAFLYRELCYATNPGRMLLGGVSILLQMWSWMRFPIGRPEFPAGRFETPNLRGEDGNERPPLGCFLCGYHSLETHPTIVILEAYRQKIDCLDESEVNWQPYKDKKDLLSPICNATPELWTTTAPLIHFGIVEMYNPQRVMRQFGCYQNIPPSNSNTDIELHRIQTRHASNWPVEHAAHLHNWNRRWQRCLQEERGYDPSAHDEYMQWFSQASIMYLHGPAGAPNQL